MVLSVAEIERLLAAMTGTRAAMARLQYGAGLRVSELVRLRVKDVDLERGQLVVRGGKGNKDRTTLLPSSMAQQLTAQRERARELYDADLLAR